MITTINDFNLRPFNTLRLDAKCSKWIEYTAPSDIPAIMAEIGDLKYVNIGSGSNMLFDGDYYGAVLHSGILDLDIMPHAPGKVLVHAGAGIVMDDLILQLCQAEFWGLENLSGIPGEVGASAVQNVGAYGVEASDVIVGVECYDTIDHHFVEFSNAECRYGYRHSMFKENRGRYVITYVNFIVSQTPNPKTSYGSLRNLRPEETSSPLLIREAIINIRNQKLPKVDEIGSAGSFFMNPVVDKSTFENIKIIVGRDGGDPEKIPHYFVDDRIKIPAAWLIDYCGLKGSKVGGAEVWNLQPLVIVNASGHATAADIIGLEKHITTVIDSRFGIKLKPEVEHIC